MKCMQLKEEWVADIDDQLFAVITRDGDEGKRAKALFVDEALANDFAKNHYTGANVIVAKVVLR